MEIISLGEQLMKDPRDIILEPVVSEKSYQLLEQGVYTFRVQDRKSTRLNSSHT